MPSVNDSPREVIFRYKRGADLFRLSSLERFSSLSRRLREHGLKNINPEPY